MVSYSIGDPWKAKWKIKVLVKKWSTRTTELVKQKQDYVTRWAGIPRPWIPGLMRVFFLTRFISLISAHRFLTVRKGLLVWLAQPEISGMYVWPKMDQSKVLQGLNWSAGRLNSFMQIFPLFVPMKMKLMKPRVDEGGNRYPIDEPHP